MAVIILALEILFMNNFLLFFGRDFVHSKQKKVFYSRYV